MDCLAYVTECTATIRLNYLSLINYALKVALLNRFYWFAYKKTTKSA